MIAAPLEPCSDARDVVRQLARACADGGEGYVQLRSGSRHVQLRCEDGVVTVYGHEVLAGRFVGEPAVTFPADDPPSLPAVDRVARAPEGPNFVFCRRLPGPRPEWDPAVRAHFQTWLRRVLSRPAREFHGHPETCLLVDVTYVDGDDAVGQRWATDGGREFWLLSKRFVATGRTLDEAVAFLSRKPVAVAAETPHAGRDRPDAADAAAEVAEVRRLGARHDVRRVVLLTFAAAEHGPGDVPYGVAIEFEDGRLSRGGRAVSDEEAARALRARAAPEARLSRSLRLEETDRWSAERVARMRDLTPELMAAAWAPERHVDWCLDVDERRQLLSCQ